MRAGLVKKILVGTTGALIGALFFGFFAVAPLPTIKAVLLICAFVAGVGLFAGLAVVLASDD